MNAFDEYSRELSLLAAPADPLPALLLRRDNRPWRRTYARFHPQQPSYCTLLYEGGAPVLPLRISLYRDGAAALGGQPVLGLGVANVAPPTADEALGTLQTVLARHPDATVVRYRPQHRCTFRAAHTRYVKVFAEDALVPRLHAGMHALWQRRDQLGFAVAQPLDFDDGLRFVSQAALPGTALADELLGPHGLDVATALGRAAATLPLSEVTAEAPMAGDADALASTKGYARAIAALLPEYGERVTGLVLRLQRLEAACPPARSLAIHGGLHPSQWLRCGDGLGLVDFDRLCRGDPELDVATFVTELRYEGSAVVPTAQLCRAFTNAYAERVPLDAQRIDLYVGHKEVAKLMRLARQPRPDAPLRFARALERIEQAGHAAGRTG